MFMDREIKNLSALINSNVGAEDILNKSEIDAIKKTTNINRIKDSLFVPSHKKSKKTITLVKVVTFDFNFQEFILNLISSIRPMYELRFACSFIMFDDASPTYVYSIPSRSITGKHRLIRDEQDENELMLHIKQYSYQDFLQHSFQQRSLGDPFEKSGYRPVKLVCLTAWITKYDHPTFSKNVI